jgi:putative SOS response-associated peptidase YedK
MQLDDKEIFGFAGLWERAKLDSETILESCTIITMPANALMAGIHNSKTRMPAILARGMRDTWLFGSPEAAAAALVTYPDERMIAYPVDPRVNSAGNNDETLLDPLQTDDD